MFGRLNEGTTPAGFPLGVQPGLRVALSGLTVIALMLSGCADGGTDGPAEPQPHLDWNRYHLDLGNTAFNPVERTLTPENVGQLTLAWSFVVPGSVYGSPAVSGGKVIVGDQSGTLWILKADNGELIDRLELGTNEFLSGAYATPTVEGDFLYYQDAIGGVGKYDMASRKIVWHAEGEPNNAGFSSPAVWEGRVYHGNSNGVADSPCTVGRVQAHDKQSGKLLWTFETVPKGYVGGGVWNSLAVDVARNMVVFGTSNPPAVRSCGKSFPESAKGDNTDSIVAVNATSGRRVWGYQAVKGDVLDQGFTGSSVVLFNDGTRDLAAAGMKDGRYYAVDRASGALAWKAELSNTCGNRYCGGIFAPGGFAYGKLFVNIGTFTQFPDVASAVVALDPKTGLQLWRQTSFQPQLGGPAIANHMVFIGSGQSLSVFAEANGEKLFEFHTDGPVWSSPAVVDSRVYFGSNDHHIYALKLPGS